MRNINELVGIFEGVNFDGIINRREIEDLQIWISQNRNLAYDPKQMKLIKLVDDALKDGVITEFEREQLKACAEELLLVEKDYEVIYELNGIIEGIICDGVVNEDEIYHLNEWRRNHELQTCGDKECESLYAVIDEILEDGIVSEEEKHDLLQFLNDKVSNSQFETKLSYLRKQIKLKRNIGIDLIDLLDNVEAMRKIHQRAEKQLCTALQSYSGISIMDPEVVVISLSLIAMLEYDGAFYDKVKRVYIELYNQFNEQKIDGLIRSVLSKYRTEEDLKKGEKRIINVALYNSIVPRHFLSAFFDFIYDIYKLNFEYNLPNDLYEEFKFVYEGLRSSMMSEGDDVQLNVTKKTYKLIKTSKQLIADPNLLDAIIKYSIIIVKLIDKKIWDKEVLLHNPYLKHGYEEWCKHFQDHDLKKNKEVSGLKSRWDPKFVVEGNDVYLIPPIHKVKAQYNAWDYHVQILNDNVVILETDHLQVFEIIAGYKIVSDRIKIEKPLNKISYRLTAGKTVLYDSKDKLYRDFIVFNESGFEIRNNSDYKGTAIFCYKGQVEGVKQYWKSMDYNLASKIVQYGDSVFVAGEVFNFSALQKPGVFGELLERHYLVTEAGNEKIRVYKQIKFLVFESETNYRNYEIIINDVVHDLFEFHVTVTSRNGVCKYVVDLPIGKAGIYKLSVFGTKEDKRHKIAAFSFVVDPTFETRIMKLDDTEYAASVQTAFHEGALNVSINATTYNEYIGQISNGMQRYNLMVPFELDFYRLSNGSWNALSEELWIGDIKADTVLDIHDFEIDEMVVYSSFGQQLAQISLKDRIIYRQCEIGFLTSYKEMYDYEVITLLKAGKVKKAIFCNNKCILKDSTEINFNPATASLTITPTFYGKGNVCFEIYNRVGESVFSSGVLKQDSPVVVSTLSSFERYKIVFYEKMKGLSLKKNREMKVYERSFFARKDFVGNSFRLSKVYYMHQGEKRRKALARAYVETQMMDDSGVYYGNVYWNDGNSYNMELHISGVTIELCSDVIDNKVELIILKKGNNLDMKTVYKNMPRNSQLANAEIVSYTAEIEG